MCLDVLKLSEHPIFEGHVQNSIGHFRVRLKAIYRGLWWLLTGVLDALRIDRGIYGCM